MADIVYKVAVLIDGGYFDARFMALNNGMHPRAKDLTPFITQLLKDVQAITGAVGKDILFRTFYYDCRPYGDTVNNLAGKPIDFSNTGVFKAKTHFFNDLRTFPGLALRLGDLSFDGWKIDPHKPSAPPKPDFKQKGVDMKIGMDISWMASKRTCDKIVLVAGDSDFITPMKFARKEGLITYLHTMGQKQIKLSLKEHADYII